VVAFVELAGTRTVLLVPMLKDGEPIGYLARKLRHQRLHPRRRQQPPHHRLRRQLPRRRR